MSIFEYDEEKHMRTVYEEGYEIGKKMAEYCPVCALCQNAMCMDWVYDYMMTMSLELATERAVDQCIREGILSDFIQKNRSERISVFEYDEEKQPLTDAVERAVDDCIKEGILADFLRKNRSEVISSTIFEYEQEERLRTVRNKGLVDGRKEVREEEQRQSALRMIETGKLSLEEIALCSDLSLEQVLELEKELQPV